MTQLRSEVASTRSCQVTFKLRAQKRLRICNTYLRIFIFLMQSKDNHFSLQFPLDIMFYCSESLFFIFWKRTLILHDQKAVDSTWSLQKITFFAGWSLRLLESNLGLDSVRYLSAYLMLIMWLDSGNSTGTFTCRKQGINFACWNQDDFYWYKWFYINSGSVEM